MGDLPNFNISVSGLYRDHLSRQVAEAVKITTCEGKILNSKAELRQSPVVSVRREVNVQGPKSIRSFQLRLSEAKTKVISIVRTAEEEP